jgi:hypothetical protein
MLQNAEFLGPGIVVYRDTFTKELDIINRLENVIGTQNGLKYNGSKPILGMQIQI